MSNKRRGKVVYDQRDRHDRNEEHWVPMDFGYNEEMKDQFPEDSEQPIPDDAEAPNEEQRKQLMSMPDVPEAEPEIEERKLNQEEKDDKRAAAKEKKSAAAMKREWAQESDLNSRFDAVLNNSSSSRIQEEPSRGRVTTYKANKPAKPHKLNDAKEIEKHQSLVMQIDRYNSSQRFSDTIQKAGLRINDPMAYSIEELEQNLTRIRTVIGNRSSAAGGIPTMSALFATSMIERSSFMKSKYDVTGLTVELASNPEFSDLMEQLSIDNGFASLMSPEKRMLLLIGKTGFMVHKKNEYMMQNAVSESLSKSSKLSSARDYELCS